jgi:hypothetical protein
MSLFLSCLQPKRGDLTDKSLNKISNMMEYKVKPTNSLNFSLTRNDNLIGNLTYENCFSFKAKLELPYNSSFQIEPKGFWGTEIEVKDNEKKLMKFEMNCNGDIIIQTSFGNKEQNFIFKHSGFLKNSFVLIDKEKKELVVVKPDYKWYGTINEYNITTTDFFDKIENQNFLLLAIAHCAYYYDVMTAGSVVVA